MRSQGKTGPIAVSRTPGGDARDRRAGDVASSTFATARFQAAIDLSTIPVNMTSPPPCLAGLLARLDEIESKYNALLTAMKDARQVVRTP